MSLDRQERDSKLLSTCLEACASMIVDADRSLGQVREDVATIESPSI